MRPSRLLQRPHNVAVYVLEVQRQLAAVSQMQDLQGSLSIAKQLCILYMQCRTLSHSNVPNINTTSQDGMRTSSMLSCNLPCIPQGQMSHFNKQPLESSAIISAESLLQRSAGAKA